MRHSSSLYTLNIWGLGFRDAYIDGPAVNALHQLQPVSNSFTSNGDYSLTICLALSNMGLRCDNMELYYLHLMYVITTALKYEFCC